MQKKKQNMKNITDIWFDRPKIAGAVGDVSRVWSRRFICLSSELSPLLLFACLVCLHSLLVFSETPRALLFLLNQKELKNFKIR